MSAEVVKKYPEYYHPEIIAIREGAEQRKQSREMLKGDINSLEKSKVFKSFKKLTILEITSLAVELRQMKNSPGPSLCNRCTVVGKYGKLSAGSFLVTF